MQDAKDGYNFLGSDADVRQAREALEFEERVRECIEMIRNKMLDLDQAMIKVASRRIWDDRVDIEFRITELQNATAEVWILQKEAVKKLVVESEDDNCEFVDDNLSIDEV